MKKTFMFITLLLTAAVSYAQPQLNKSNIDEVIAAMPPLSIATLMGGEDNIRRFESEIENLWGKAEDGELRWVRSNFGILSLEPYIP